VKGMSQNTALESAILVVKSYKAVRVIVYK
jgi:hypothetical protein